MMPNQTRKAQCPEMAVDTDEQAYSCMRRATIAAIP